MVKHKIGLIYDESVLRWQGMEGAIDDDAICVDYELMDTRGMNE